MDSPLIVSMGADCSLPLLYWHRTNVENHSKEELLRNPRPDTAAAAARDFGIDLTLTIENLRITAEERVRRNDDFADAIREIQANSQWLKKSSDSSQK